MIKPNVGELAKLVGVEHWRWRKNEAAKEIISKGGAEIQLYHWDLKVHYSQKILTMFLRPMLLKKVLLVLEIAWSVGWYGLWPKIKLLKKSFVGE
jgi:hypothetical protein